MATPSSFPISMSQVKAEFNKGNNLRAYLGCAPGVPTSGTIRLSNLLGKDAWQYYMAAPFTRQYIDAGYHYSFVNTDNTGFWTNANHPEIPNAIHLNGYYPSDNWGINTDYGYEHYEGAIVNSGDISSQMNAFSTLYWGASDQAGYFAGRWFDMMLGSVSGWQYSNSVGANATYLYGYWSQPFYDQCQQWAYWSDVDNTYSAMRMK